MIDPNILCAFENAADQGKIQRWQVCLPRKVRRHFYSTTNRRSQKRSEFRSYKGSSDIARNLLSRLANH
jgi:hypothetical protein